MGIISYFILLIYPALFPGLTKIYLLKINSRAGLILQFLCLVIYVMKMVVSESD